LNYDPKEKFGRGYNPTVRNVWLERFSCENSKYGIFIIGLDDEENVYDIHFRNSKLNGVSQKAMRIEGKAARVDVKGLYVNGIPVVKD
jgi:hypothetical protein